MSAYKKRAAISSTAAPITQLPDSLLDRFSPRPERFFRLDEVLQIALQLELVVARLRRSRRRRRLVGRNLHVPVVLESGTGRNQPPPPHVLLQAAQMIDLAGD